MDILKKVQNTDPLKYVPERYYEELKKVFNVQSKGKEDSTSINIELENIKDENVLKIINEMIDIGKKEVGTPIDCKYKLNIGMYMRKSKMEIPECDNKTIYRVVYNLGYGDVYNFMKPGDKKSIFFEKNSYMVVPLLDYKIIITSKTMNNVPNDNIHVAGFSNKPKVVIRPIMYQRITIVIDYSAPENITEDISKTIHDITDKINNANELTKTKSNRKKNKALYSALGCNKPKEKPKPSKSEDPVCSDSDDEYGDEN